MYQVLIDICKPDESGYKALEFNTYCEVTSKLRKDINSCYKFVYVRKVLKEVTGKFRLVLCTSYTFAHFHPVDDETQRYLDHLWRVNYGK